MKKGLLHGNFRAAAPPVSINFHLCQHPQLFTLGVDDIQNIMMIS